MEFMAEVKKVVKRVVKKVVKKVVRTKKQALPATVYQSHNDYDPA